MHLLNQRIAGIIILLLWAMLVVVKAIATGSLLKDRPRGGVWIWLIHIYNFLFLLVAAPLAAVLMIVRHPIYTAALSIALGLACLTLSWAYFCMFSIYVILILSLIPFEEEGLRRVYGERYVVYRDAVKRLAPPFF
jgi:protein-S-isoprenylcysteine O-methyltransferase Ste14